MAKRDQMGTTTNKYQGHSPYKHERSKRSTADTKSHHVVHNYFVESEKHKEGKLFKFSKRNIQYNNIRIFLTFK